MTTLSAARAAVALAALAGFAAFAGSAVVGCGPDRPVPDAGDGGRRDAGSSDAAAAWIECQPGQRRCLGDVFQQCFAAGTNDEFTRVESTDCTASNQICVDGLWCVPCRPDTTVCSDDETQVLRCRHDGTGYDVDQTCNSENGEACRNARCVVLCQDGSIENTNIGCEYFAADLDNAVTGDGRSAASQQYAVVVSNPDRNLTARVRIEMNTAPQGMPPHVAMVQSAVIGPMDLETFRLPAREVDCSMPGTFNTGTGTCLSSQAYRITSSIPVVAYQFNPLENVSVFSNDASLLVPTNSISGDYMVLGWPQTIATTMNPMTNFDADLRAYLAIVGTAANTTVTVTPTTNVIPGGPVPAGGLMAGRPLTVTLGPFDVLNLETGGFNADFTGSTITSDHPVAVFSGSEASDSPYWSTLSERQCCADHMEEQIYPRRTAANDYVLVKTPSRTQAVSAAGGMVAVVTEPQWFRVLAVGTVPTHVTTTLHTVENNRESPLLEFDLMPGAQRTIRSFGDFEVHGDAALSVATFTGSQQTTGIPNDQPGGDPSFIMVPPIRQWRQNYVFLTPDKYAFDFVTIVAKPEAQVWLDDTPLNDPMHPFADCTRSRADECVDRVGQPPCDPPNFVVYRCQLSFPIVDPTQRPPNNVHPGRQQDGVHTVTSDDRQNGVMVLVNGFDQFVGYGYPAGTRLMTVD